MIYIEKLKRGDGHCHACDNKKREYKYLYHFTFGYTPNTIKFCKKCLKELKIKLTRFRWNS